MIRIVTGKKDKQTTFHNTTKLKYFYNLTYIYHSVCKAINEDILNTNVKFYT